MITKAKLHLIKYIEKDKEKTDRQTDREWWWWMMSVKMGAKNKETADGVGLTGGWDDEGAESQGFSRFLK